MRRGSGLGTIGQTLFPTPARVRGLDLVRDGFRPSHCPAITACFDERMRALIADPKATGAVRLADVAEPAAKPDQALVSVTHASLNSGDLNDARSGRVKPGAVLGSDAAGTVVAAAANGGGPSVGTRVVCLAPGAFAERLAVTPETLAEIPDAVDMASAAALPVAGLAALQALRAAGPLDGKRVLITGASGGVGRFAVQLAAIDAAQVIASVGSVERGAGMSEIGADQVGVGIDGVSGLLDVIIDNVGGEQMVAAWGKLGPGGKLMSVGWVSGEPATFPPYSTIGPGESLVAFLIGGDVGGDLALLTEHLAAGRLTVEIGWQGGLADVSEATEALRGRTLRGKAIFDIGG